MKRLLQKRPVAMASLHGAGHRQVELWVTAGNDPAEGIYERLVFRDTLGS